MNFRLAAAIGRATRAVRANNLLEGMRRIQDALSRPDPDEAPDAQTCPTRGRDGSTVRSEIAPTACIQPRSNGSDDRSPRCSGS